MDSYQTRSWYLKLFQEEMLATMFKRFSTSTPESSSGVIKRTWLCTAPEQLHFALDGGGQIWHGHSKMVQVRLVHLGCGGPDDDESRLCHCALGQAPPGVLFIHAVYAMVDEIGEAKPPQDKNRRPLAIEAKSLQ
eukprot:1597100-Pleurochrysis_carterae.AAC.1